MNALPSLPVDGQVRTAAEILPLIALAIDRDRLARRDDVVDDLRLVRLADRLEVRDRRFAVPHFALDRQIGVDDLLHALFDLLEIVRRERLVAREVVVEAVLDRRADRHLRAGKQFLHRLRQHVRRVVAQHFEAIGAVARDQVRTCGISPTDASRSHQPPFDLRGDDLLGQRLGNALGDRERRDAVVVATLGAVGKFDSDAHALGSFNSS